jgi:ferrous iron transport protein B
MSGCHAAELTAKRGCGIALVGHPNVGKSVLFQRLTGRFANVSNYPGTTVEVARGSASFMPSATVIDTPGIVAFPPRSEDELVAARVLLEEPLQALVQVGDAKSLRRTLLLTVQLAELGVPMVLTLNMADEAEARGVTIDAAELSRLLHLRVARTVATRGVGLDELAGAIRTARPPRLELHYDPNVEETLSEILPLLPQEPVAGRALGLLWLSEDPATEEWLRRRVAADATDTLARARERLRSVLGEPVSIAVQRTRLAHVDAVAQAVLREAVHRPRGVRVALERLTMHRFGGWVVLAAVLYAMYWFVGVFGAGTLVGLVEENLFGEILNPWLSDVVESVLPSQPAAFVVGEYGLWTMGMTYALALVLPIVTTFFLAFSILEDSGYLARLTVVCNRLFTALGLNGRAVLPMVLGLGCVTMATLTTRVLATRRERLLATLLLALAVPCSAQLGVVLGMLGAISLVAGLVWGAVVLLVLVVVGALAARLLPGERSTLVIELPPLRFPVVSNVLAKTLARLEWYLREVVPLFLLGTAALFALDRVGGLPALIRAGEPVVSTWLGLPAEASAAFLLGFLRRDFGATGLFVMESQGELTAAQAVVAMVTITLFVPCVASVLMIAREWGVRTAATLAALIFPLAFLVGGVLNRLLALVGWGA